MRVKRPIVKLFGLLVLAAAVCPVSRADEAMANATWIWESEGGFLCHARRCFEVAGTVRCATVQVTADNGYEIYVNGSFLGSDIGPESIVWQSVESYDITSLLKPGTNVVAIRATDLGGQAGLIAAVSWEEDGKKRSIGSDRAWRTTASSDPTGYAGTGYVEDNNWKPAKEIGRNGCAPWGIVKADGPRSPKLTGAGNGGRGVREPGPEFAFPERLLAVRGRVAESSTPGALQAAWRIGNSRACLELDTLGPSMPGRSLALLKHNPATRSYTEETLYGQDGGLVGSPSVAHDGKTVFFSCVLPGEKFWRICRLSLETREMQPITNGKFHDFDPEPLPNGTIALSSTRVGNREEYHGNLARSIFLMNADGTKIRAITHHIVGDTEPRLTAAGNIVFVRQDNFMERAKVETHIHSVRPDGTAGQVLLGPNRGALSYNAEHAAEENGLWLRNYGFGSPAPLPDGRVAAISSFGLTISGNAVQPQVTLRPALELVDVSALPDGRLLCTLAGHSGLGVLDLDKNEITRIHSQPPFDIHSPIFAGPRPEPPATRSSVNAEADNDPGATGFLLGQSVYLTQQRNIDISRVKAIRVIEGRPFALRSARHPYDHLGVEAIELGTAPIAPDGSFYIEVPADRALSIQAVDGQGRSVVNELSWIYVRPGEQRSCVGCHSQREAAPPVNIAAIMALRGPPVKLLGQGAPHRWRGNNAANGGVLNLQFERMREIGSINSHRDREASLRLLETGSEDAMISAAQHLALLRDKSAAPKLERALTNDSPAVRLNAALALGSCGTRASFPALVGALQDLPPIRHAAHASLETLTAKAVTRRESLLEPAEIEKVEAALIEHVRFGDVDVLNALAQIGSSRAAAEIREFLQADDRANLRVTLAGIQALGQIGCSNSIWTLAALLRRNSQLSTNRPAGDHEFGWTQAPVQIAAAAAQALGRIGTPESEKELVRAFGSLADFWHYSFNTADHDWLMGCHASPIHFRIVEALDRLASSHAASIVGALLRSIPIDPDRALLFENDSYETLTARVISRSGKRSEIVRICSDLLFETANDSTLLSAVTNSPPAVSVEPMCAKSRAAQILSIIAIKEDAALLRSAYARFRAMDASRARSWTCFYLARAIGKIGDKEAVEALTAALLEEKPESALGLHAPPNVFVYEGMTPFHRAAAADALGRIGVARAGPALLQTALNLENAIDVRNAAAQALVTLSPPEMEADLKNAAASCPEIATKRLLALAHRKAAVQRKLATMN